MNIYLRFSRRSWEHKPIRQVILNFKGHASKLMAP